MTDPDPDPEPRALPAWVEQEFANRRAYWAVLRDGGLLTPEAEAEAIRRQVADLGDLDGLRAKLRRVDEAGE